jgi:sulfite exporter TauE/SafE
MLASIHPLGERARHNRWSITVTAYVLGSVAAGTAFGAGLGAVGRRSLLLAVAVTVAAAAADLVGRDRLWPTVRRQVNDEWMTEYRGWIYGLGFGLQLGLGLVTIVTSAAIQATWVVALLSGSAVGGAVIGAAFGLARALPVLALGRVDDTDALRRFHRTFQRWALPVRRGGAVLLLAAAGTAVVAR